MAAELSFDARGPCATPDHAQRIGAVHAPTGRQKSLTVA
jgi:hypothetical protein